MWLKVHETKGKQQAKWASSVPQMGPKDPRAGCRLSLGSLEMVLEKVSGKHAEKKCATSENNGVFAHFSYARRPALAFLRFLPGLQGFAFLLDGFAPLLAFQDDVGVDRLLVGHFAGPQHAGVTGGQEIGFRSGGLQLLLQVLPVLEDEAVLVSANRCHRGHFSFPGAPL